ncbi:MAG: FimB/Mfa2 family fimbrial subunit [Tannerella sp.]|jgi:hypothetical protein|nr:FimB/Mfa2 family fimbrial subunit [Tannerella sp.]
MTTYICKKIKAFLYSCLFILAFAACSEELVIYTGESGRTDDKVSETRVNFSIRVPSQIKSAATKSVSDEGAVDKVHILLFKAEGSARTFSRLITVDDIAAGSNMQKTFQVTLPVGLYDIVVLANAQEIIDNSGISFGDTKEEALNALVERNASEWDGDCIPMWGRRDNQTIDSHSSFVGNDAISMIRMLAKIEVEVTPEAAGANGDNFVLTSIRLYNYSSQGALVPDLSAWPADNVAVMPSEPAVSNGYASMSYPANPPLAFDSRVCYTFEAPAGAGGKAMAANTCLIIGGSYRGRPVSFYRVDFVDRTAPGKFLPLLRNHHYLMKIVKVNGDGYPTPELAFETTLVNMEVDVLPWNDGSMENVSFDGQNTLEVSKSAFTFANGAQTAATADNRLTIRASVASGWEIEKITDASGTAITWLTASERSFASPNVPKDVFLFAEENTTGTRRTAYLYIRAGQLSFRVTVVQQELFDMRITDGSGNEINELVFPLAGGTAGFSVNWTPATASVTVAVTDAGQSAAGTTGFKGTGFPAGKTVINGGSATYGNVRADAYTGGDLVIHRASKVDFTINDGNAIVTRTLFLRQFDFNLIPVIPSFFLMDGGIKKIGVRANTTWEVIDVIDPDNIITNRSEVLGKTGGLNVSAAGEDLPFRIVNRQGAPSVVTPVATIVLRNALGTTFNATITGLSTYEVGNLLVWPVDMPIAAATTWYNLADVPDETNDNSIPPAGPRNTTVHPYSCAALDPSNKNLWRLPTLDEIYSIFSYFRSNGGYGKYGMTNVDYSGNAGLASITNGYWTAESYLSVMVYYAAYNTTDGKGGRGAIPKNNAGPVFVAEKTWNIYARCVRTK